MGKNIYAWYSRALEVKLLRFYKQLILCIALFAFIGDFIISGLGNGYLTVNFQSILSVGKDIQPNLTPPRLKKYHLKIFEEGGEKKVWSLIDPVNWTIRLIGVQIFGALLYLCFKEIKKYLLNAK